jgi:hypothetical protein
MQEHHNPRTSLGIGPAQRHRIDGQIAPLASQRHPECQRREIRLEKIAMGAVENPDRGTRLWVVSEADLIEWSLARRQLTAEPTRARQRHAHGSIARVRHPIMDNTRRHRGSPD